MSQLVSRIIGKLDRGSRALRYRLSGYMRDTITTQTKQGLLTMSTHDVGIGAPLFRNRQYEFDSSLRCIQFLKESGFVPDSDVHMIDVGANIGLISTGLLLAGEVSGATAIEPEPGNFQLLTRNAKQNGLTDQMCCLHMAVNDVASTLTMEISPTNPGDHRIRAVPAAGATERSNESARKSISVPALPLPDILNTSQVQAAGFAKPSLIWIDVQGYEGYVFSSLEQPLPTVSEVWPYGILRAGMTLQDFHDRVSAVWTDYWVCRRRRFVRYPISVFDRFMDELGQDGRHENVIFTHADHTAETSTGPTAHRKNKHSIHPETEAA